MQTVEGFNVHLLNGIVYQPDSANKREQYAEFFPSPVSSEHAVIIAGIEERLSTARRNIIDLLQVETNGCPNAYIWLVENDVPGSEDKRIWSHVECYCKETAEPHFRVVEYDAVYEEGLGYLLSDKDYRLREAFLLFYASGEQARREYTLLYRQMETV